EEFSGVTLHKIDEGIDTGDIIDQEKIYLNPKITSLELYQKCCKVALELFIRNYELLVESDFVEGRKQTSFYGSYYSKKSLNFSDFKIDFRKTATEVSAQIRA